MAPAEGIRKLGFRRWYERELIEGHVYFVTCFLSMIVVAVCLEQIDWGHPGSEPATIFYIVGGILMCMVSLRRYNVILVRAECLGRQSVCAACRTYGVLQVLDAGRGLDAEGAADNPWLRVQCKKCGHQWSMDSGEK